jgi:hypothetical protein
MPVRDIVQLEKGDTDSQGCSEIIGESSEKRGIVMATFNSVACKSVLANRSRCLQSVAFNAWLPRELLIILI